MFTCALCRGSQGFRISQSDAKTGDSLDIRFCEACGLVQQSPIPSLNELRVYYSHHYRQDYKKTYFPKLKYVYRAGLAAKSRMQFLTKQFSKQGINPSGLALLDIGAGGGEVVYAATKHGFTAQGIEPNEGYAEFARDSYGVQVDTMHLDQFMGRQFDVVTMFHVLEHMPNPHVVMEKVFGLLNQSGYFLVEVPNIEQADASPSNIYFKAHLYYFSAATLVAFGSPYFDPVLVDTSGNLKILFKKREASAHAHFPSPLEVEQTKQRLMKKGWLEYLTVGGGWEKPFSRISRDLRFKMISEKDPRAVLDRALS